ncbi:NAD-dependent epimerase/dehydratase family protein [Photobacterium sanctipauli]|uniref:NAD-dependent epimerase/dehydratase family protein n=1 Tax=Photobacterium sanctipauli TaxID=1342794 RepID=UPI00056C9056|nr:NAD-dependent epimerase/dehydratase family protein [Photobacterium sanctipauli]
MKTVLVTGANGFIGKSLVGALGRTYKVRAAVRNAEQLNPPLSTTAEGLVSVGNITKDTDWHEAVEKVDTVIHLAARAHVTSESAVNPLSEFRNVNRDGAVELLCQAAASGVRRFVFVSSIGVNGAVTHGEAFSEDQKVNPISDYAISKYEAEQQLTLEAEKLGIELVIVRPALVYGEAAPGNIERLRGLVTKVPLLPFGMVNNRKSFVSINNLVSLLELCIYHPDAAGQTFLAADNETISTRQLVDALAKAEGVSLIQLPIPVRLMKFVAGLVGKSSLASQLFDDLEISNAKARKRLGWNPTSCIDTAFIKK